jgi:hypothetical protein
MSNPIPANTFNLNQLVGNAGAVYLFESLQTGSIMPKERNIQQAVRIGIANGAYQSGFLVGPVASVLSGFGVTETVALQGVVQGLLMGLMDKMMPRSTVGYQMSLIEGIAGAYAGDALGKSVAPFGAKYM